MDNENGKIFSITCDKGLENYVYNIERSHGGRYSLEKLEKEDEDIGNSQYKRKFYLKNPLPQGNDLLFVSIKDKKISVNRYILENKSLKIQKNIANISYEVVNPKEDTEVEFNCMNDAKKAVCVFNVERKAEVIPAYHFNNKAKEIKGRYKLDANENYVILKLGK